MCEVARRCGAEVVRVDAPWGARARSAAAARRATRRSRDARLVAVVHAETSTGVENDIAPLRALQATDTLLLVDTVTSLGGIPVEVDGWGIDACYSGTQKCLGVPPGLAPLTFSARAVERVADPRDTAAVLVPRPRPHRRLRRRRAQVPPHRADRDDRRAARRARRRARRGARGRVGAPPRRRHAAPGRARRSSAGPLIAEEGHRLPQLTSTRLPDGVDEARAAQGAAHRVRHRGRRRPRRVRGRRVADRADGAFRPRTVGHDAAGRPPRAALVGETVRFGPPGPSRTCRQPEGDRAARLPPVGAPGAPAGEDLTAPPGAAAVRDLGGDPRDHRGDGVHRVDADARARSRTRPSAWCRPCGSSMWPGVNYNGTASALQQIVNADTNVRGAGISELTTLNADGARGRLRRTRVRLLGRLPASGAAAHLRRRSRERTAPRRRLRHRSRADHGGPGRGDDAGGRRSGST